jgi:hypothetical protein
MLSRWRAEFDAGRATVRMAARGGGRAEPVEPPRPRISFPDSLDEGEETRRGDAGAPAAPPLDAEGLRILLGEVREIAELSQARIAELETELTAAHWRADRLTEVLELAGVRRMLLRLVHPDAHPGAGEDQRRALTEASSKINAAYDLIDRAKDKKS